MPAPRPACTSIRYWSAAPIAPPPGATLDSALPASCEAITGLQRSHMQGDTLQGPQTISATACSAAIAGNQAGAISPRSCHEPRTSITLGATRYRDTPVRASQNTVRRRLGRDGCCAFAALDLLLDVRALLDRALQPIGHPHPG